MKINNKIISAVLFLLALTIASIAFYRYWNQREIEKIQNFEDCIAAGNPAMESFPRQCRTKDGRNFVENISSQEITVTGTLVCLPHKDQSGPQTLECAYGLKDNNGDHYSLSDPNFKYLANTPMGVTITIKGKYKPVDNSIYDILGTIEIESISK